jgi:hypothetical protein
MRNVSRKDFTANIETVSDEALKFFRDRYLKNYEENPTRRALALYMAAEMELYNRREQGERSQVPSSR